MISSVFSILITFLCLPIRSCRGHAKILLDMVNQMQSTFNLSFSFHLFRLSSFLKTCLAPISSLKPHLLTETNLSFSFAHILQPFFHRVIYSFSPKLPFILPSGFFQPQFTLPSNIPDIPNQSSMI